MSTIAPLKTIEDYQSALETTLDTLEEVLAVSNVQRPQTLADADQWLDACRQALAEARGGS